jgi:hypothetical protein
MGAGRLGEAGTLIATAFEISISQALLTCDESARTNTKLTPNTRVGHCQLRKLRNAQHLTAIYQLHRSKLAKRSDGIANCELNRNGAVLDKFMVPFIWRVSCHGVSEHLPGTADTQHSNNRTVKIQNRLVQH